MKDKIYSDEEMPLFFLGNYKEVMDGTVRIGRWEFPTSHYELSKDSPEEYKRSYEKYCEETGAKPIYF